MRIENTFLGAEQVGERTEQRLWEQGVSRWEAFHRDCRGIGPTRAERIEQFIDRGRRARADGDTRFFGERLPSRERLAAAFEPAALLVTFNGARFDIPFLESSFGIDLDHPHIDLVPTCRRAGIRGGQDTVENRLGIDRALPEVDGREAIRLWRKHERGVDGALERLIAYNREDTENMVPILEQTVERLDRELLPESHPRR